MSGGKETGRQKMIGMMYLVLTALLAMNVSKEVVDAFVTIDQGQRKTLQAIDSKLGTQMLALDNNAKESPDKYGAANTAAISVHNDATNLIKHINLIKAKTFGISVGAAIEAEIPAEVYSNGKFLIGLDSVKALVGIDNYDNNTNLMIKDAAKPIEEDNPDGNNYTAVVLRNKLVSFRENIISELRKIEGTQTLINNVEQTFDFPTKEEVKGEEEEWVVKNFYHVPLAASTAMLTTLQSQIRSAESDLIDKLYSDVEGASYKFTKLTSAVIPQATTVSQGSNYEAEVFLSAYDDQNAPEIRLGKGGAKWDSVKHELVGEFDVVEMDGTKGMVKIPAGGLGSQQREGVIIFRPVGLPEVIEPFKIDFSVVAPQLIVSPTKMNVFYRGLSNPVSISVPGFTDDQVKPSISTGSLTKGSEGYVVKVSSGTEANVSASVTLPDGSTRSMPPVKFRIKKIPDPVPSFGQKRPSDNVIAGTAVRAAQGVRAVMENFDFELSVTVASYKVVTVVNGEIREAAVTGNRLNANARGLLDNMRRGQKFSIEEIKVNMPDGVRKVPGLSLRII